LRERDGKAPLPYRRGPVGNLSGEHLLNLPLFVPGELPFPGTIERG
jgi:hypothetical protein